MKTWNSRWLSLLLAAFVALGTSVPAAAQVLEIEPATEEAEGEAELEAAAQGGDMPNSGAVALGAGVDVGLVVTVGTGVEVGDGVSADRNVAVAATGTDAVGNSPLSASSPD